MPTGDGGDAALSAMTHALSELAGELFEDFLRRRDAGEPHDLEQLCREHPNLREELERLAQAEAVLEQLLPGALEARTHDAQARSAAQALMRRLHEAGISHSRYELLGELGRGGMGVVLRVRDDLLRRELAMKVARGAEPRAQPSSTDVRTLARFLSEAQLTSQLDHPGVVPVHELGLDAAGRAYFTMRLVRGEELGKVFARVRDGQEGWTAERAVSVVLRVCETMSFAHHKRVLHRDLKPSNVMVGEFGEVYVMDWGLARTFDAAPDAPPSAAPTTDRSELSEASPSLGTLAGDVLGTPNYMAPEQAAGRHERVGPHSDVYAVGAMLYELIAGAPPYAEQRGRSAVLAAARAGPPRSLSELAPQATAELVAICEKAMAREVDARYASMRKLAEDLRAYTEGRVVRAFESGAWAEAKKWISRNRALALALAALLLALSSGMLVSWRLAQKAQRSADLVRENAHLFAATARLDNLLRSSSAAPEARGVAPGAARRWLRSARELLNGEAGGEDSPLRTAIGLEHWEARLEQFVAAHVTPLGREDDSEAADFPRAAELEQLRLEVEWRLRMLGSKPWPDAERARADLESSVEFKTSARANSKAFDQVRLDDQLLFGGEVRAVALGRRAVELARTPLEHARALDTLAFALARTGSFDSAQAAIDDARSSISRALLDVSLHECAPTETNASTSVPRSEPEKSMHEYVGMFARSIRGNQSLLQEFIDGWTGGEQLELTNQRLRKLEQLEREAQRFAQRRELPTDFQIQFDQLSGLVEGLRELRDRVELALRALENEEAAKLWRDIAEATGGDPRYGGKPLSPQIDLLPLGRDPRSGLWEFAHLPSGAPPVRDSSGRLRIREESSIVFVLLPRARAIEFGDLPTTERDCEPLFVSKFELTCAQWMRLSGEWPARYEPRNARMPVTMVSWEECVRVLARSHSWLRLPSEREWERAARAGAGAREAVAQLDHPSLLAAEILADSARQLWLRALGRRALVADRGAVRIRGAAGGVLLRVDSLAPNAWGLHHTLGNASELCNEPYADDSEYAAGNIRRDLKASWLRKARGGYYGTPRQQAFDATQVPWAHERSNYIGLRPVRPVLP